ncbi:MAG: hypothetical protein SOT14_01760, partial [Succinivibrio sp.]|nr:hypothetical protein [Succinivibrio sp.]
DDSSSALYASTRAQAASGSTGSSAETQAGAALETFTRGVMASNIAGAAANIGTALDAGGASMVGAQVPDVETLRADLLDAIETEMIAEGTDSAGMHEALETAYGAVYRHLSDDVLGQNSSVTITPAETTPAVVLAYARYGDASRADEIASRNGIHNPLFVPPRALSVLDK